MGAILKFQTLLKELFQFEASDLDFGIYRIMNYKRSQIENFIEKELIDRIESAFAKHKMENLKNPFTYKLKVNLHEVGEPEEIIIDIPETFNYLLGLKVRKIKVKEMDRKYLFILGEKDGKDYAVVWREYSDSWTDEDFKKDKEFINKELEGWSPQVLYVNGQSILTPKSYEIRYIEPEFKRLVDG